MCRILFFLLFASLPNDKQRQSKTSSNFFKKNSERCKEETKEGTKEQLCYLTEISSQLKIWFTLIVQF